jgi:glutamine synthetase type III
MDYINKDVPKMFGNLVFNDSVMKNRLPKEYIPFLKENY